jgi:hypothetical protein
LRSTEIREVIFARGHENILATHETTLEITKKPNLSKKGNCVIAVSADKALNDLSLKFKDNLRREDSKVTILIEAGQIAETVNASGDPSLILTHPSDLVVRKSSYICNRTLAVKADQASCDLSRILVEKLRNPKQRVKITLTLGLAE